MVEPVRETLLFVKMPGQGQWQIQTEAGAIITGVEGPLHCDIDHSQVHVTFNIDTATMRTAATP